MTLKGNKLMGEKDEKNLFMGEFSLTGCEPYTSIK